MPNNQNTPESKGFYSRSKALSQSGAEKFPNPFFDMASEYVPTNINEMFDWGEYIYSNFGTYRTVCNRVVRYFITELVLDGGDKAIRESFKEYLEDDLDILNFLAACGDDFLAYGNAFVSVIPPFIRLLQCRGCGTQIKEDVFPGKFNAKLDKNNKPSYTGTCAKCGTKGTWTISNVQDSNKKRVYLKTWSPRDMTLKVHPITGHIEYYLKLDPKFVTQIKKGDRFTLSETPWELVVAACTGDSLFKFSEGSIYHIKNRALTGLKIDGWGVPPLLANFKLCYYIQLLRRYDEAIAFDYILPFRMVSPSQTGNSANDTLFNMGLGGFAQQMQSVINKRRQDPTSIAIAPFPVNYQAHGGEGASLAPKDHIASAVDELLNSMGFPADLFKGSLQIQAFPVALRIFERTWGHIVAEYNGLVKWVIESLCNTFDYGKIKGSLRSVTLADDVERKAIFMQLSSGMKISDETSLSPYGIDFLEEQKKIVEEQRAVQELQQQAMEEQEAAAMGEQGAAGASGEEGAPGGEVGATPGDVQEQAKQKAQELLFQIPETQRRGELVRIKHSNPTLHAMVKQEMANIRQQMMSDGYAQQQQQMMQGG